MALKLTLQKAGEETKKLRLSLNKGAIFTIGLLWNSEEDLDAHALLATNDGDGAKVSSLEQVLSTYNKKGAVLKKNPDGSFSTKCGTLTHSGDKIPAPGSKSPANETITVDGGKASSDVNEIPIFVTIHKSVQTGATFGKVSGAGIRITDESGTVLGEYQLSNEFGKFNAVQMGSLVLNDVGWEFAAVGSGFMGDFNTVIETFS